jgi:hypothetical protein
VIKQHIQEVLGDDEDRLGVFGALQHPLEVPVLVLLFEDAGFDGEHVFWEKLV